MNNFLKGRRNGPPSRVVPQVVRDATAISESLWRCRPRIALRAVRRDFGSGRRFAGETRAGIGYGNHGSRDLPMRASGGCVMKIVVVGGTGLIGSKVCAILREAGHEAFAAAPTSGVNTLTGEGVDAALAGTQIVVDLANSPSFEPAAVLDFFRTHERTLLAAEARSGVGHHVALSIVGTDRSPDNGYFQAKVAQEDAIKASAIPYSIVRSTQFMEFLGAIADAGEKDGAIHIASGMFQPIAADEVAAIVADVALSRPLNGTVEIAGPDRAPFDTVVRDYLRAVGDPRNVVADPDAPYFGGRVEQLSLVPLCHARLGRITLSEWIRRRSAT